MRVSPAARPEAAKVTDDQSFQGVMMFSDMPCSASGNAMTAAPPTVRARLWVSGYRLWPPDRYPRLWLGAWRS